MTEVYKVRFDFKVPIPPKEKFATGSYSVHPLALLMKRLKPEQSFIYPAASNECRNRLRSIADRYAKKYGFEIATRTVTDREGVKRLRIWRKSDD